MGHRTACVECSRYMFRTLRIAHCFNLHSRTFTYTTKRWKNASLPIFQPTSSAPLDTILNELREKVFIPATLFREQRNLIYRKSQQHLLLNPDEPVTITLSTGEPYTLRPLDHLTDEPNAKKALLRAITLMKEGKDFDTIPGLLEGYKVAKRSVSEYMKEKMTKKCAQAGKGGIILRCIQEVERTGFKLDDLGVARAVMMIPVFQAANSEWSKEGLEKASKSAESILNMLEDPRHVADPAKAKDLDPRIHPDLVGLVLAMFATRAVRFQSSQDEDGKVAKYTERMLSLWENADLTIDEANFHTVNFRLANWAPAWQGMNMALRVLNSKSETGRKLSDALQKDVQPLVEKARDMLLARPNPRGTPWWGMKVHLIFADILS